MLVKGCQDKRISRSRDGKIWYKFDDGDWKVCNCNQIDSAEKLLHHCRVRSDNGEVDRLKSLELINEILAFEDNTPVVSQVDSENLEGIVKNLINFFSEFHFEPNFRFVNTFAYAAREGRANSYVDNYFRLTDSPYTNSIEEKMKSQEWGWIVDSFSSVNPSKRINTRLRLYFGSQGTGKTTLAMGETQDCVVCHSAMLPSDLMEDFDFDDGKAKFKPSTLWKAMENGYKITLDEINLLPFESLRFLQSILDGKSEFTYKGQVVKIHQGFEVIGTMNLVVNGCTYALPDPLVDRAFDLKEFKLTEKNLVSALM